MSLAFYPSFVFQSEPYPSLSIIIDALTSIFSSSINITREEWGGNPRDGFQRWVRAFVEESSVHISFNVALEGTGFPQSPDILSNTQHISATMKTTGQHSNTLYQLWRKISNAMALLGYKDQILTSSPKALIEALESTGSYPLAQKLRSECTEAIIHELQSQEPYWPLTLVGIMTDDLNRVLRSVRDPKKIQSITLYDCNLETLPEILIERPVFFPALQFLSLSHNPLKSLPNLKELYPKLEQVDLMYTPIKRPKWEGVKIYHKKMSL